MPRFLLFFFLLLQTALFAQPHIEGKLTLQMKEGIIDADFTLSNLPPLAEYRILLNHGMNIQYFTSDSGKQVQYDGFYGGKMQGEALEYVLLKGDTDTLRPLPAAFRIKYRGAYPIYTDTLNLFDFKGYIAFNGSTLRATEQSKWYPVIYDVAADRLIDNYTYHITVNAGDSKTVYLNGSVPQQKTPATFSSAVPRALFLFAGNYDYVASRGNYILNASVDSVTAGKIFKELDRIKAFHAQNLGLTYNENIYLIAHKAVKPYPPSNSWGFTVFPSFAYANLNFKTLVDGKGRFSSDDIAFFAHELSHFYFGDNVVSGTLQWFWLESATEYLSLKAAAALTDTAFYNKVLNRYVQFVAKQKYPPLARINKSNEIDENYRYVYGPLILTAFEKQFGLNTTYKVLAHLIKTAEKQTLTLETLKQAAIASKIKESDYDAFYATYLDGNAAQQHVLERVSGK